MKKTLSVAEGVFFFSSTIIGAGILALPVAAATSGFPPLVVMLCVVAGISVFSALYISEAVLAGDQTSHLPSLAAEYLGPGGMIAMLIGTMIYIYGALIGYLSVGGQVLFTLSNGSIPVWAGTLLYFGATALILLFGLKLVSYAQTYLFLSMLILLGIVIALCAPRIRMPLLLASEWAAAPDVFGVVLFAYVGHSVIPSIANGLCRRKQIVLVSVIGVLVPFALYTLWSATVMGIVPLCAPDGTCLETARQEGQPATVPLGILVGGSVIILGNAFAILSTMTSYIGFAFSLTDEYQNVFVYLGRSLKRYTATALVVLPPMILALLHPSGFVRALGVAGTYGGGLFVGILPALIAIRIRRKSIGQVRNCTGPTIVLLIYLLGMLYVTVR